MMSTEFKDFLKEIEDEAKAKGAEAIAELEALRKHFCGLRKLLQVKKKRATKITKRRGCPND